MSRRRAIATLTCLAALLAPASASAYGSNGTHEQIAWVRRAATNFVSAELRGDGAGACAILNAPLRATERHRTCAERWDARLSGLRRDRAAMAAMRADRRAISSAAVAVHGDLATIDLPTPLMNGGSRFVWTENCWMLRR
jgi:hypothetical protein